MQHLPFLPQKEIPYLGGPRYAGEGLEAFVERTGWTPTSLRAPINLGSRSPNSKLAFFQSLLNLALVVEFLDIRGVTTEKPEHFLIRNGSALDTSSLPQLIDRMDEKGSGIAPAIKDEQEGRAAKLLGLVSSYLPKDFLCKQNDVMLAAGCMVYTVFHTATLLGLLPSNLVHQYTIRWEPPLYLFELLFKAGWCPRQIAELSTTDPFTLYYITTLKREPRFKDHQRCTTSDCVVSHVDSGTYQSSHTPACTGCDHVGLDEAHIRRLIAQGIVPRLSVEAMDRESPVIHLADTGPYAAISHVWAHGLGNPRTNSLPACQLQRLQSLADMALKHIGSDYTKRAFWIDTLCVPLEDSARKQALSLIRKTFREAACTVVLDYEMERLPSAIPDVKALWRLAISDWARRLWTFEESVVSEDRLWVKFDRRLFNATHGFLFVWMNVGGMRETRTVKPKVLRPYKYDPWTMINPPTQRFQNLFSGGAAEEVPWLRFCILASCASNLRTTHWEDETLCLASAMDIDTKALALLPAEYRMEKLLSEIQTFPAYMMFGTAYRLKEPGTAWAPKTFLVQQWHMTLHIDSGAPQRLRLGHYHSIPELGDLKGFDTMLGGYDLIKCATRIRQNVLMLLPGATPPLLYLKYRELLEDPAGRRLDRLRDGVEERADAELVPQELPPALKVIVLGPERESPAVLVQSMQRKDGIEHVKFLARMIVVKIKDEYVDRDPTESRLKWQNGEVVHANPIASTQRWFVR